MLTCTWGLVLLLISALGTWCFCLMVQDCCAETPQSDQCIVRMSSLSRRRKTLDMQGIRVSHKEFRFLDGASGTRAKEVYSSLKGGTAGQDCNGHGTHVAGTVGGLTYGPAKNVSLLAVRSLECLGNGTVSQASNGCAMQPSLS